MLGFAPISSLPLSALYQAGNYIYFTVDTTAYIVTTNDVNFGVYPYKRLGWKSTINGTMSEKSKLQTSMGWNSKFETSFSEN